MYLNILHTLSAGFVGFVDDDLVNQFVHDLRRERFDMLISMHNFEERRYIGGLLFSRFDKGGKLRNCCFELFLFVLISCLHHRETLV